MSLDPEEKLFPGMTASVSIIVNKEVGVSVPMEALYFTPDMSMMEIMKKKGMEFKGLYANQEELTQSLRDVEKVEQSGREVNKLEETVMELNQKKAACEKILKDNIEKLQGLIDSLNKDVSDFPYGKNGVYGWVKGLSDNPLRSPNSYVQKAMAAESVLKKPSPEDKQVQPTIVTVYNKVVEGQNSLRELAIVTQCSSSLLLLFDLRDIMEDIKLRNDLLWPHRWSIYDRSVYMHGKRVYDFNLILAKND